MKKTARILFIAMAVASVLIGVLHLLVHFDELATPALAQSLNVDFPLKGQIGGNETANAFDLWQGMSIMMGYTLLLFGLTHLVIGLKLSKEECPPIPFIILMILQCVGSVYTGIHFFGPAQIYGGLFGIICLSISLFITISTRTN